MSPRTVGVEEEVMLLDPLTWSVANRIDEALAALAPSVARHASAETHACVVELRTDPHPTVGEAAAELSQLRASLDDALQETLGLRAAVAGTHPLVTSEQVAVSCGGRYRQVSSSMRSRGSPNASARCSSCSRRALPTPRSPRGSWSAAAP